MVGAGVGRGVGPGVGTDVGLGVGTAVGAGVIVGAGDGRNSTMFVEQRYLCGGRRVDCVPAEALVVLS